MTCTRLVLVRRTCLGCSHCGENHPSDDCCQPDKVISMLNPVGFPQQQQQNNMRGGRLQGGPPKELRPLNWYYDDGNARQTSHSLAGLQTANGYIPIQNRPRSQYFNNRMQVSFTDLDPSNSQDVKFMDGVTEPHPDESIHFQMGVDDEQGQNVM